jgi:hypothetical protein
MPVRALPIWRSTHPHHTLLKLYAKPLPGFSRNFTETAALVG